MGVPVNWLPVAFVRLRNVLLLLCVMPVTAGPIRPLISLPAVELRPAASPVELLTMAPALFT